MNTPSMEAESKSGLLERGFHGFLLVVSMQQRPHGSPPPVKACKSQIGSTSAVKVCKHLQIICVTSTSLHAAISVQVAVFLCKPASGCIVLGQAKAAAKSCLRILANRSMYNLSFGKFEKNM